MRGRLFKGMMDDELKDWGEQKPVPFQNTVCWPSGSGGFSLSTSRGLLCTVLHFVLSMW